ncbi:hypothetical protein HSBAA_29740 [Vreelandella sulfidaeris]|uniref:Uncharacterized protein n=1 Tax=Vreelandella sulfidaeris TaxID=115553 RepID=A0A455UBI8_9GAMM|nr:hypothetical protein HSBAA_29740 [Halomonas sulfidaeris]
MALGDYRSHMDKVGQRNEQFRNQLSSLDGSFTRTTARAGNLISNLPRLGMAFMSLAGPIGMGISIIASAGYALLGLAGDLDGLADSIIRTRGMIASNADLDKLRDSSEELQAEYASNHDAMTRAIHTARRTTSDAIRQEAQSTVEAMMARNGVIKNQLNEYGVAIEEGQRGIQFRLVEGSKATTDRMIQGFFDPISAQYNATRIQLEQMRVEANGDASKLQDIHNQVVQAIETAYNQKREIIDREERLLEERRRSLGNVSTEIGQQKLAEIEAALLALESKRTEIESIKAESIVTTNMANEFIVKPLVACLKRSRSQSAPLRPCRAWSMALRFVWSRFRPKQTKQTRTLRAWKSASASFANPLSPVKPVCSTNWQTKRVRLLLNLATWSV